MHHEMWSHREEGTGHYLTIASQRLNKYRQMRDENVKKEKIHQMITDHRSTLDSSDKVPRN